MRFFVYCCASLLWIAFVMPYGFKITTNDFYVTIPVDYRIIDPIYDPEIITLLFILPPFLFLIGAIFSLIPVIFEEEEEEEHE